jgi:1,4-alpha-glucan branching enzyme
VLPLSHDEVVHGKGSLIAKMPGDDWQKFANLRAYYGFMWSMPGKKLLFMGGELGEPREWDHESGLDWALLEKPAHAGLWRWVRDLATLYRAEPALHQLDCEPAGFEWIDCADATLSTIAYLRRGVSADDAVLVACNFTPVPRHRFRIGVPAAGHWKEILNGDAPLYGGSGQGNLGGVQSSAVPCHGRSDSVELTLPPLALVAFKRAK